MVEHDVTKHCARQKHPDQARLAKQSGIQGRLTDLRGDQVTKAEILFTQFIAEHNLSFAVGDHITRLVKTAFPDRKKKCQL